VAKTSLKSGKRNSVEILLIFILNGLLESSLFFRSVLTSFSKVFLTAFLLQRMNEIFMQGWGDIFLKFHAASVLSGHLFLEI
jgi:hypothetical protein